MKDGEYQIVEDAEPPETTDSSSRYFSKNKFLCDLFKNDFIRNYYVKKVNGQLVAYVNGSYRAGSMVFHNLMLRMVRTLSHAQREEVLKLLQATYAMPESETEESPPNYIKFTNGVYDIETDRLYPNNPTFVILNTIPWAYNADATCAICDKTMNKIASYDAQIRAIMDECIGYCFYRSAIYKKAFILTGYGNNGKSVWIDMLQMLLGNENMSALPIQELGERFSTSGLYGKLANIYDDIPESYIDTASTFKNVTSGGKLKGEEKGQPIFYFRSYAKLIFSANEMPRIRDGSGAAMNRLLPIPCKAEFKATDVDFDPKIREKVLTKEGMEYLILIGIAGLKRLLAQDHFSQCEASETELSEIKLDNDPILAFLRDNPPEGMERDEYYNMYQHFCDKNRTLEKYRLQAISFVRKVNRECRTVLKKKRTGLIDPEFEMIFVRRDGTESLAVATVQDRYNAYIKRYELDLEDAVDLHGAGFTFAEISQLEADGWVRNDNGAYIIEAFDV